MLLGGVRLWIWGRGARTEYLTLCRNLLGCLKMSGVRRQRLVTTAAGHATLLTCCELRSLFCDQQAC